MILALVQRATSHIQETSEVRVGMPAKTFCDIPGLMRRHLEIDR
jgi:hypothetical protein